MHMYRLAKQSNVKGCVKVKTHTKLYSSNNYTAKILLKDFSDIMKNVAHNDIDSRPDVFGFQH